MRLMRIQAVLLHIGDINQLWSGSYLGHMHTFLDLLTTCLKTNYLDITYFLAVVFHVKNDNSNENIWNSLSVMPAFTIVCKGINS